MSCDKTPDVCLAKDAQLAKCQKKKGSANQKLHVCWPTNQMAGFH